MGEKFNKTLKTSVSRYRFAASFDKEFVYSILDEALFCDVAYNFKGSPFIIPTGFVRKDDHLYIHGSVGSHFLRTIKKGTSVCISITLLDGIVLAKTAFDHNVNYRSVILFSTPEEVTEIEEQLEILKLFTNKMIPDSWEYTRLTTIKEQKKTTVLRFKIEECSAKHRSGMPPIGDGDKDLKIWSGIIPIETKRLLPIVDESSQCIQLPIHLK